MCRYTTLLDNQQHTETFGHILEGKVK